MGHFLSGFSQTATYKIPTTLTDLFLTSSLKKILRTLRLNGTTLKQYKFVITTLRKGQATQRIHKSALSLRKLRLYPWLVYETPDRDSEGTDLGTVTKSVNYSVLYMKFVKALQEAQTRIETLETKVSALEAAE